MTMRFRFAVSCYRSGLQRLMSGSRRESTFISYMVTGNTKERIGTLLHNIYGTPGGPNSPEKSDRKKRAK